MYLQSILLCIPFSFLFLVADLSDGTPLCRWGPHTHANKKKLQTWAFLLMVLYLLGHFVFFLFFCYFFFLLPMDAAYNVDRVYHLPYILCHGLVYRSISGSGFRVLSLSLSLSLTMQRCDFVYWVYVISSFVHTIIYASGKLHHIGILYYVYKHFVILYVLKNTCIRYMLGIKLTRCKLLHIRVCVCVFACVYVYICEKHIIFPVYIMPTLSFLFLSFSLATLDKAFFEPL